MKTLIAAIALTISSMAVAGPLDNLSPNNSVCYGREYSEAHMASHPKQTVKSMKLKFWQDEEYTVGSDLFTLLNIDLQVKNVTPSTEPGEEDYVTYKPYTSGMICDSNMTLDKDEAKELKNYVNGNNYIRCYIECDGGSSIIFWEVQGKSNKTLTLVNRGFVAYGTCGDELAEGEDSIYITPEERGDDVFELYALPAEYCEK